MSMVIFWALDPAVCVPDLRVAEQQHGLGLSVIMCIICARLTVAIAVMEVPGLPDLAQGLSANIKERVKAVGLALLRGASGRRGGGWAEKHLRGSEARAEIQFGCARRRS